MKRYIFNMMGIIIILTFVVGCAQQSRLAMDYGTSYQLQKYNQIINPEAEKNLAAVEGINGKAAGYTADKYEKSFEKEKKAITNYQISVGSVSGQ